MSQLQTFEVDDNGFFPSMQEKKWQVAILNFLDSQKLHNINKVEIHNETDEVFLLQKGRAILIIVSLEESVVSEIKCTPLKKNIIYSVPKGCWHNIVMSEDAKIFIVENRDTHLNDVKYHTISKKEQKEIQDSLIALGW